MADRLSVGLLASVVKGVLRVFVPEICVDWRITKCKQDVQRRLYEKHLAENAFFWFASSGHRLCGYSSRWLSCGNMKLTATFSLCSDSPREGKWGHYKILILSDNVIWSNSYTFRLQLIISHKRPLELLNQIFNNYKIWGEIIACFPLIRQKLHKNDASKNYSIGRVFVAAVTFLPSVYVATVEGYT
jgi:hypothetical protein